MEVVVAATTEVERNDEKKKKKLEKNLQITEGFKVGKHGMGEN